MILSLAQDMMVCCGFCIGLYFFMLDDGNYRRYRHLTIQASNKLGFGMKTTFHEAIGHILVG